MAMKLVALLVLLIAMTNDFVECRFRFPGIDFGFGHGSRNDSDSGFQISETDIVVAQDGSGQYSTIKEALKAMQGNSNITINVKSGVYNEYLLIPKDMKNLRLNGDGIGATIITGNHGDSLYAGNFHLSNSATVAIEGDGFVAQGITFRNTAGITGNQSAALRVKADQAAFYQCSFEGYQDTIFVQKGRNFFKNCDIYGNVDFICGTGPAVFQDCNIILHKPKTPNGAITIAASSREDPEANEALVFQNCSITAGEDLGESKIFLGRPWKSYAQIVYMETSIDVPLQPAGWRAWNGNEESTTSKKTQQTVVLREFNNRGIGANTERRVYWQGFKVISNEQEAEHYTVANILQGSDWIPRSGIPFYGGLELGTGFRNKA